MLFNSIDFAVFLPIIFTIYWLIPSDKIERQNILVLFASYFFYAYWDWRFVFLLIFSTLLDYFSGIKISQSENPKIRKLWFWGSIIINLGILAVFKYYNFFIQSMVMLSSKLGIELNPFILEIVLPIGISFYTFHGVSYVIDVYKRKIKVEKNIISYALFVSFFPLLVAGPIERAQHLLPQINNKRIFSHDKAVDGMKLILWGLFKKVVIANQCAEYVDAVIDNYQYFEGSAILIASFLFSIQVYGDFSGYSDIALGTANLLGFSIVRNFNFPLFSENIQEFWRKWHISLYTWFKDYIYIPLGGGEVSQIYRYRNTILLFVISGFWHGGNWTFIFWGIYNAIMVVVYMNFKKWDIKKQYYRNEISKYWNKCLKIILTFSIFTLGMSIFFRAKNLEHSNALINKIFSESLFSYPSIGLVIHKNSIPIDVLPTYQLAIILILFFIVEWFGQNSTTTIFHLIHKRHWAIRWMIYYLIFFLIIYFSYNQKNYVYFQF